MVKDNTLLYKVIDLLCVMMNQFDQADKKKLYNSATGKAGSVDIEQFLLSVNVRGETAKKSFTSECIKRPVRLKEIIAKQKMQTLETESGRKKIQRSNGKVVTACLVRDLFGSLLCLPLEEKIDIAQV